jgi:hypothetical protein
VGAAALTDARWADRLLPVALAELTRSAIRSFFWLADAAVRVRAPVPEDVRSVDWTMVA